MAEDGKKRRTWSSRFPLLLGFFAIVLTGSLIGTWAMRANISGAVIGSGTISTSQMMTAVQHPVGGVIEEILAKSGDQVEAGDVVVRLDDLQLRTELASVEGSLFEVMANIARLEAEIDGRETLDIPEELAAAALEIPDVANLLKRQERQLRAHFESLDAETRLLDEQVKQVKAQIVGLEAQLASREEEMGYVDAAMVRLDDLAARGLAKHADLYTLQKSRTTVSGELGRLSAKIAELRGKTSELELKRLTILPKEIKLATKELSRIRPERTKFIQKRAALQDKLRNLEIRAPISGRVHDVKVQGIRSVVVAAKPLMMIVPDAQPTVVAVRIKDTDIDQVAVGQEATLKFTAFDGRHMPIILANVRDISADVLSDPATRKRYYAVTLEFEEAELAKLGDRELKPGMPIDAFLSTESRTPLNYVLRPLKTYLDRAFRDA
jgi:HlyD family secretion protein